MRPKAVSVGGDEGSGCLGLRAGAAFVVLNILSTQHRRDLLRERQVTGSMEWSELQPELQGDPRAASVAPERQEALFGEHQSALRVRTGENVCRLIC